MMAGMPVISSTSCTSGIGFRITIFPPRLATDLAVSVSSRMPMEDEEVHFG